VRVIVVVVILATSCHQLNHTAPETRLVALAS
jgi:hypothetical protein